MKRKILLLFTIFIILFTLTGCSLKKKVMSLDDFQEYTVSKEFNFFDVTENFDYNKDINKAGMAANSVWQVEFYIFNDKEKAEDMYDANVKLFKKEKTNTSYLVKSDGLNYKYFSLTNNKLYMYICRVDNTVVYCKVPVEYRNNAKRFIKNMGY